MIKIDALSFQDVIPAKAGIQAVIENFPGSPFKPGMMSSLTFKILLQ